MKTWIVNFSQDGDPFEGLVIINALTKERAYELFNEHTEHIAIDKNATEISEVLLNEEEGIVDHQYQYWG